MRRLHDVTNVWQAAVLRVTQALVARGLPRLVAEEVAIHLAHHQQQHCAPLLRLGQGAGERALGGHRV